MRYTKHSQNCAKIGSMVLHEGKPTIHHKIVKSSSVNLNGRKQQAIWNRRVHRGKQGKYLKVP
jgi:hypothetical protein